MYTTAAARMKFRSFVVVTSCLWRSFAFSANPEIADNSLGITSRACADNYCLDKDSLDLWLAIEWECHEDDVLVGDGSGPTTESTGTEIVQAPSRKKRRQLDKTYAEPLPSMDSIANLTTFSTSTSTSTKGRNQNYPHHRSKNRSRRRLQTSSTWGAIDTILQSLLTLTVSRILTALLTSVLGVVGILIGYRVGRTSILRGQSKKDEKEYPIAESVDDDHVADGRNGGRSHRSGGSAFSFADSRSSYRRRDYGDSGSSSERQRLTTSGAGGSTRSSDNLSIRSGSSRRSAAAIDDDDDDDDEGQGYLDAVYYNSHLNTRGKLHSLLNEPVRPPAPHSIPEIPSRLSSSR